jgi:hypothetical protein
MHDLVLDPSSANKFLARNHKTQADVSLNPPKKKRVEASGQGTFSSLGPLWISPPLGDWTLPGVIFHGLRFRLPTLVTGGDGAQSPTRMTRPDHGPGFRTIQDAPKDQPTRL